MPTAKPNPWYDGIFKDVMPTTSPERSSSGPPLFPGWIVSGATKKPLPVPAPVSTRTTAGIARLITSSSDAYAASVGGTGCGRVVTGAPAGVVAGGALAGRGPGAGGRGCDDWTPAVAVDVRAGRGATGGRLFVNQTPAAIATTATRATTVERITARTALCPEAAGSEALREVAGFCGRTNPQRQLFALDGIRRSHEGQTQLNAREVVCGIRKDPRRAEGKTARVYQYHRPRSAPAIQS